MKTERNQIIDVNLAAHEGHMLAMQYVNTISKRKPLPFWENIVKEVNGKILGPSIIPEFRHQFAGQYRRTNAYILNGSAEVSPWLNVREDMYLYSSEMDKRIHEMKCGPNNIGIFLDNIAWAHYQLVKIHPFIDGNGRTARQCMDLLCKHFGIKSIVLGPIHKPGYLESLGRVDRTRNLDHFTLFLASHLWVEYSNGTKDEDGIFAMHIEEKIKNLNRNLVQEQIQQKKQIHKNY